MIYDIIANSNCGAFALLIDPDKYSLKGVEEIALKADQSKVDLFLLGGSITRKSISDTLKAIKSNSKVPVVLFPGNVLQICSGADAILLLSLISGRNPEFLIGNHVLAAHLVKESKMEVIPTGYMLIDSGANSSVQYMSNTNPIPDGKVDIAVATALAGEQLGHKAIYLEAGSGAKQPISSGLISEVRHNIDIPIIVGGGLREPKDVERVRNSGASMVVVGNALEGNPNLLADLVEASR